MPDMVGFQINTLIARTETNTPIPHTLRLSSSPSPNLHYLADRMIDGVCFCHGG